METGDGLFCGDIGEAAYPRNGGRILKQLELSERLLDIKLFFQGC